MGVIAIPLIFVFTLIARELDGADLDHARPARMGKLTQLTYGVARARATSPPT